MRPLLLALFVLGLACAGPDGGNADGDSSAEADPAHEGDDAGECADDADNDRDGAFDCDDADCAGAVSCEEADTDTDTDTDTGTEGPVVYEGTVDGVWGYRDNEYPCEGVFTLTVGGGEATGTASCGNDAGDISYAGEVSGVVRDGAFDGVWAVEFDGEVYDVDLIGTATSDSFLGGVDESWIRATFDGRP